MPAGVHISQRVVPGIAVAIQALRVARVGDDGGGRSEARDEAGRGRGSGDARGRKGERAWGDGGAARSEALGL